MRDFNDLQFFAAVVTHRGFSAAGRALGVPKSRVSRRVLLLEERLGVRLLDRTTRRIGLTEVGEQIFAHARAAILEAEAVEEVALRMQAEPRGLVRLSCPVGLQSVMAQRLPAFLSAHPLLRVQCIVTNRRVDLIEEGVDVAIRVRERLDTDIDLQMRRIGISARILVASPDFLAEHGSLQAPTDLSRLPLLSQQESQGNSPWNLSGPDGETCTVAGEVRLGSGSLELLLAAAQQGLGVALLPVADCRQALASDELVRVLPQWSGVDGILHLVFTSRRGMLPGVRAVIDFTAEALRSAALS